MQHLQLATRRLILPSLSHLRPTSSFMSTFYLSPNQIPVHLPSVLSKAQLLSFPAFRTWHETLSSNLATQDLKTHPFHTSPYKLRQITVQAVDFFGGERLGFVKLIAEVTNDEGEKLPGSVFLRGGSVGMMIVLQPDDVPEGEEREKHVILTVQPRIPAGSLAFAELPAGMLDDSGSFSGGAAKEIREETDMEIEAGELVDMTALALEREEEGGRGCLQRGVYPSPGGCDEFIPLFYCLKRIPRDQMREWEGKLTGLRDEGEKITLKLCPLDKLWRVGGRDAKVLAAWALYQGLRGDGKL